MPESAGIDTIAFQTSRYVLDLAALAADEALLLARMHADIATACLAAGGTVRVRTECRCRVHEGAPLDRIASSVVEDAFWTHSFLPFNPLHG